ncbi:MAG: PHP domain-containing protein [Clostridiales bacterium]|nr:PHP domain-containing protein [Clostridiales bacterium]
MKWELHAHTAESSRCSLVPASGLVARHAEAGFSGIVITDHYNLYNLSYRPGTPLEQALSWLGGYEKAREAGERLGLTVLFGVEITLASGTNDYLVYGTEPDFLTDNPALYELDLPALHALTKRYHALLIQAHPNREYCSPADPADVDGYEVFNGNPRQENRNGLTAALADKNPSHIRISGSDYHQITDLGTGCTEIPSDVHTSAQLADILRSGAFRRASDSAQVRLS